MVKKFTQVIYILIALLIAIMCINYAELNSGDYIIYKEDYEVPFYIIKEPIYNLIKIIYIELGLKFELFHSTLIIVNAILISNFYRKNKVNIVLYIFSITYMGLIGWAGHFRAAISTLPILLFAELNKKSLLISSMIHFASIPYLISEIAKYRLKLFIILILTIFLIFYVNFDIVKEILEIMDKKRFINYFEGISEDYEQRNLLELSNPMLYFMTYLIVIGIINKNNIYSKYILMPPLMYLLFSFNAYLAQKIFLNMVFLMPIGIQSISNKILKYVTSFSLIMFYAYSINMKFYD